jgi:hypothetical protein
MSTPISRRWATRSWSYDAGEMARASAIPAWEKLPAFDADSNTNLLGLNLSKYARC